ncbi:MAG: phospholipase [Gammaproteobacteria bacterium]|nr:phospholipase [Gammaproteobacteria bacterium]
MAQYSLASWRNLRLYLHLACLTLIVSGCASIGQNVPCLPGEVDSGCIPVDAVEDSSFTRLHDSRTWVKPADMEIDPIQYGIDAEIPIQETHAKLLGPSQQDSLRSIAAKIWMIDNAEHTIDAAYYIFKRDLIGKAMIGALCNAVKRGVDVRLMVDSIGSLHPTHGYLKSLVNCSDNAGYMRNESGQVTTKRARAQVVIFNALSKVFVSMNRRSHDKIMVVDGHFPEKAFVMTGGRNISLDYYGLTKDGSIDPDAYKDLEILLRPGPNHHQEKVTVGSGAEIYMTVLYLNPGNKFLSPWFAYRSQAEKSQQALTTLRGFDNFERYYAEMDSFMVDGFSESEVRLAHELGNLKSRDVVGSFAENLDSNPNSIVGLMNTISQEASKVKTLRIVSPYLFMPEYTTSSGKVLHDGKDDMDAWLAADPERRIEIVTNSVLTSDNFLAQSIIDMDMAPRVLLTDEMRAIWEGDTWEGETNPQIVESQEWKRLIANPRIKIYQLGRLDSEFFGGDSHYGKLHAKFVLTDVVAFVGTTNLDYRSRLYNNEMGYFLRGVEVKSQLLEIFETLKQDSYLWGSPEWLEMRDQLRRSGTTKGGRGHRQRKTYDGLRNSWLKWQI